MTLAGKQSGLSHEHMLNAKNWHPGPISLRRATQGAEMIEERDIFVAMRDGTRLALDVYRPDKSGRYPVLYAAALHNKDMQGPDVADVLPPNRLTRRYGSVPSRPATPDCLSQTDMPT